MSEPILMPAGYTGTARGTLVPTALYPITSQDQFREAQAALNTATAAALAIPIADFYLVGRPGQGSPMRIRWRIATTVEGPSLAFNTTGPHSAEVRLHLWLYPMATTQQCVLDPLDADTKPEMPYRTVITGALAALLLRHFWGPDVRTLSLGGLGSVTFTPVELEYTVLQSRESQTASYSAATLAAYPFVATDDGVNMPALWLSLGPEEPSWKVSYCVVDPSDPPSERWDDPNEPIPAYDEIPWPV
jgi:hypothetical protein